MLMKQIIEAYDVLDDTYVTGKKVEEYLRSIKPDADIEVYELVGPLLTKWSLNKAGEIPDENGNYPYLAAEEAERK